MRDFLSGHNDGPDAETIAAAIETIEKLRPSQRKKTDQSVAPKNPTESFTASIQDLLREKLSYLNNHFQTYLFSKEIKDRISNTTKDRLKTQVVKTCFYLDCVEIQKAPGEAQYRTIRELSSHETETQYVNDTSNDLATRLTTNMASAAQERNASESGGNIDLSFQSPNWLTPAFGNISGSVGYGKSQSTNNNHEMSVNTGSDAAAKISANTSLRRTEQHSHTIEEKTVQYYAKIPKKLEVLVEFDKPVSLPFISVGNNKEPHRKHLINLHQFIKRYFPQFKEDKNGDINYPFSHTSITTRQHVKQHIQEVSATNAIESATIDSLKPAQKENVRKKLSEKISAMKVLEELNENMNFSGSFRHALSSSAILQKISKIAAESKENNSLEYRSQEVIELISGISSPIDSITPLFSSRSSRQSTPQPEEAIYSEDYTEIEMLKILDRPLYNQIFVEFNDTLSASMIKKILNLPDNGRLSEFYLQLCSLKNSGLLFEDTAESLLNSSCTMDRFIDTTTAVKKLSGFGIYQEKKDLLNILLRNSSELDRATLKISNFEQLPHSMQKHIREKKFDFYTVFSGRDNEMNEALQKAFLIVSKKSDEVKDRFLKTVISLKRNNLLNKHNIEKIFQSSKPEKRIKRVSSLFEKHDTVSQQSFDKKIYSGPFSFFFRFFKPKPATISRDHSDSLIQNSIFHH